MSEEQTVSLSLELNTEKAETSTRKILSLFHQSLAIVRKLTGGNESLQALIDWGNRAIMVLNHVRLAIIATQVAAGPIGWAYAGVSIATTAVMMGEMVGEMDYNLQRGY